MATTTPDSITTRSNGDYALGYTNSEHDRLIRQHMRIAPCTERLFRAAGIGPGQRVLDLGSGVGDVSMLLAQIVGPTGEVVGFERDASSIARAQVRVSEAGLRNVSFVRCDATEITSDKLFDAVAGRFILMFLPDPTSVLRSLVRLVRPGGIVVFQEPTWIAHLAFAACFPLWSRLLNAIHTIFVRSGVNPEMGPALYGVYQDAGLPAPSMHAETLLGNDASLISVVADVLISLQSLAKQHSVPLDELGDLNTLAQRIHAEVLAANRVVGFMPLIGVWSRKPM